MFWVEDWEHAEAGFMHDEFAELAEVWLSAVELESWFAFLESSRVIAEGGEVAAFDCIVLFLDRVDEAALDVLFGAWAVADD